MLYTLGMPASAVIKYGIRRLICDASDWLGIVLNEDANSSKTSLISLPESRVSVWVIPTDEELMIARHTGRLLGLTS